MVVELRDKLAAMEIPADARQPVATSGAAGDVVSALLNLGYEQRAAEQAVERAKKDGAIGNIRGLAARHAAAVECAGATGRARRAVNMVIGG